MEEFRSLPEEYSHAGNIYKLHERGKRGVIYFAEGEDNLICEVFVIKIAKATILKFKGKDPTPVPERERVPGNEDFGDWAWCVSGSVKEDVLERAGGILKEIEDGIRPAPVPVKDNEEPIIS